MLSCFVLFCINLYLFFVFVEPPVTIVRKMEDQRFPDGALISLECELSRHNVDVKWLKVSTWFCWSLLLLRFIPWTNAICCTLKFHLTCYLPLYFRMGLKWSRARSCAFTAWAENAFFRSWSVKSKTLGLTPATPETLLHHATWMFMVKFGCFSLKKEKNNNKQTNSSLRHQVSVFGRIAIVSCLCQIQTSTARLFEKSRQNKKLWPNPIHGNNHQQVLKWKARSVKSHVK